VVQRALKMFEGEVQTAGIQMEFVITDSFKHLNVDWVKIDPSRVLQVRQSDCSLDFCLRDPGPNQPNHECHQIYDYRGETHDSSHPLSVS
jgi:hypothetical protein